MLYLSLSVKHICHNYEVKPFDRLSFHILHLVHTIKSSHKRVSVLFQMFVIVLQNTVKKVKFFM